MLAIVRNTPVLIREAKFRFQENGFAYDGFAGFQGKVEDGVGIEPDGDRLWPPQFSDDDRLLVIPVSVRTDQPAPLAPAHIFREISGHVAAVHFTINQNVYA